MENKVQTKSFSELFKYYIVTHQYNFTLGSIFFIGILLSIIGVWVPRDTFWYDLLMAISTSLLASVFFYWLYSKFAERAVLADVAQFATEVAAKKFLSFQSWTPEEVYNDSETSKNFERDYSNLLSTSKILWFKGTSGIRTSFTLTDIATKPHQLNDIRFILLDPMDVRLCQDLARDVLIRSGNFSCDQEELEHKTQEKILEVYITLTALFDIRNLIQTQVVFIRDHLFYRSEIFNDGMFLTYYIGGKYGNKFDPRQRFSIKSLAYRAYTYDFTKNFCASKPISFTAQMTEKEFLDLLVELGSTLGLDELRVLKTAHFRKFE